MFKNAIKALLGVALLVYPFLVYIAVDRGALIAVLAILVSVLFLRVWVSDLQQDKTPIMHLMAGIVCLLVSYTWQNSLGARFYPVVVNLIFLYVFATSLYARQSMIEKFARMKDPKLSPEGVVYTRNVTKVWCVFFFINGAIAGYTALYSDIKIWTLYNGMISYVLIGMLFTAEWIYRHFKQKGTQ